MTIEELSYIKDAFSQIINDIAGNPDWHEATRAVASDLGTLERKLEEKISPLPSNLDEAAIQAHIRMEESGEEMTFLNTFKAGAKWMAGQGVIAETEGWLEDSKEAPNYDMFLVVEPLYIPYGEHGLTYNDKVIVQIRKKEL